MVKTKLQSTSRRWHFFFLQYGKRVRELFGHFGKARLFSGWWWLELLVRIVEMAGGFVLFETLMEWVKWNTRPLTPGERSLAGRFFGDAIRLDLVRVDLWTILGSAQWHFAYVSLHTVNCWKRISDEVLIHELVHVWQYEQFGAAYLAGALRAQRSPQGYNYGGVEAIKGRRLADFNFEQQAEIAMDFFRLKKGLKPRWGSGGQQDLEWYLQILAPHFPLAL